MAILTIGLFAFTLVILGVLGAAKEAAKNRSGQRGSQSFYAAESAAREGAYQFTNETSYVGGNAILLNGTLEANSAVENFLPWPNVNADVVGRANNGTNYRKIVYAMTVFPEGEAFRHAIFAENNLDLGGNATVNGDVFANGSINFTGNSTEVNGNVFSPNPIADTDNINGEAFLSDNQIPSPQIKIDEYENIAVAAGTFYANADDAENYVEGSPSNPSVVFVRDSDEMRIQNANTNLSGSLVVDGDLGINGGVYHATGNYAALIVNGNLRIGGGTKIYGVVYVTGLTTFGSGNNEIHGSLISTGGISMVDISGSSTINFDPVAMSNWRDIVGLDPVSGVPPQIIGWREE